MQPSKVVDHAYRVYASRRNIPFTEMEYGIPRAAPPRRSRRVVDLIERRRLPVSMPYEVRFTRQDDAFLSTAAGRDTCYIAIHQYRGMDFDAYFRGVERIMDDYDGRPHWGKRHFQTAATLGAALPGLGWIPGCAATGWTPTGSSPTTMSSVSSVARKHPLVLILVAALALRVGLVATTGEHVPWGDATEYDEHATYLVEHGTYPPTSQAAPGSPAAFRPPAWPYLLAGVYEVTGARWTAGRLTAAVLGTLSVLLIWLIARAAFGFSAARWAGWLAAVFPPMVFLSGSLVRREPVRLPDPRGGLGDAAGPRQPAVLGWAVLAGPPCGLAALTRSNGLVLLAPVAIGLARGRAYTSAARRLCGLCSRRCLRSSSRP